MIKNLENNDKNECLVIKKHRRQFNIEQMLQTQVIKQTKKQL